MAVAVSSHLHVVCFHPSGLSRKILHIADPGVCVCVCGGGGGGGAWGLGYLGLLIGTPFVKKFSLKWIPHRRNGPIFYYPVLEFTLKMMNQFFILRSRKFVN